MQDSRCLHLSPSPWSHSCLPGLKVWKERVGSGRTLQRVFWYWDEVPLREDDSFGGASVLLASASSPTGRQVSVLLFLLSNQHITLSAGWSECQQLRQTSGMDGWMENIETRWRVAERSRVYKLILAKVSKKWRSRASVWVKGTIRNFPQIWGDKKSLRGGRVLYFLLGHRVISALSVDFRDFLSFFPDSEAANCHTAVSERETQPALQRPDTQPLHQTQQ